MKQRCAILIFLIFTLTTDHWSLVTAFAAQWPSLFRGVVVADSPQGVRVVSVEEASQAALADLRPEDLIVSINGQAVRSIEDFSAISLSLKGQAVLATVLIFRSGIPREITLHLYSYPILEVWGLQFVPEHDIRFAQPHIGKDYWMRLGRGFEGAGYDSDALNAYLNALHLVPQDVAIAVKVAQLFSRIGQQRLREGQLAAGVASLHHAVVLMQRLFDEPLSDEQLRTLRDELQQTLESLPKPRGAQGLSCSSPSIWRWRFCQLVESSG